ncbi:MAG: hypothetical protein KDK99_11950 [Verrucomicrobiales bacterium]|nr:hypothetical protein [Verrucomicrobiales bacterium]
MPAAPNPATGPTDPWTRRLLILDAVIGILGIGLLVWEVGWQLSPNHAALSERATWILVLLALVSETGLATRDRRQSLLKRSLILGALTLLAVGRFGLSHPLQQWLGTFLTPRAGALLALVLIQLTLIIPFGLRLLRLTQARSLQAARPGTLFVGGFILAIFLGALLLKTPAATQHGISWLDALFTSTSAVCVTGLAVVDTGAAFTARGHGILLFLIQVGGLGIMTLAWFMSLIVGQGVSMRDHAKLSELFSEDNVGAMGRFVRRVVVLTLVIEALGALLIHQAWQTNPVRTDHVFFDSVFHSVSAFCNAGFSTFSAGLAEPQLAERHAAQSIILALIILGGLGFSVVSSLPRVALQLSARLCRRLLPRARWARRAAISPRIGIHTRLVLRVTFFLLIGGTLILWLAEGATPTAAALWQAFFDSVTARTAGFNISDYGSYGSASVLLMCFLMFIGGSPGGTAGGVKTTTCAVSFGELGRLIRGHTNLHLWDRCIPRDIVERCTATIVLSLFWVGLSILCITWSQPLLRPLDVVFECFSAFGTVGLSRGITSSLDPLPKVIIILSMLAGRVGLLTFVLTVAGTPHPRRYELPDGRLPLN